MKESFQKLLDISNQENRKEETKFIEGFVERNLKREISFKERANIETPKSSFYDRCYDI